MATTAEYGLGPLTFPRGWFMVAVADEVTSTPQPVRFFGKEMVLYRGKGSGRVVLLDAYCPHMRVHLGRNTTSYVVKDGTHVEGDAIRCPAHGWRYTPEGKCDDIPYTTQPIPKAACVKSHKVVEKAGCVWMWHDMEGGDPEFDLPDFAEWDMEGEGWVRWRLDHLGTLPIHPQEIVDNMADLAHFRPVHGSTEIIRFENGFHDHIITQRLCSGHRTLVGSDQALVNDTWYTGPGILLSRMEGQHPSVIMICNTPVEDGEVRVWYALAVRVSDKAADDAGVALARAYQDTALEAFAQDFELWKYKEPAISILQVAGDGPFHKERIWHRQFYNPRERAGEFQRRVNGVHVSLGAAKDFAAEAAE
ncbi:Rieske (2Fe-2S) domain protein (plasmid) [Novosphingobium aromaticivorans DSM 12444]|uniref:Rieske (2Fe-2S) domain protein n=1 Tax=Novosphingobium aromaticivorans (strain ATCC 700278 / DSM 12444 / CCUG 56034 / CIP 105152 / NBRC 16084 / F199) TaxID=279238 RepID=A4XEZ7_NOVAD|nr:Rieske 2Fe-2S domain-containing protein [Novosphingobium aromaticivorans]ABP64508.1 Rieske (2Fe-2S) domain protein [Novosphingobium aromaticivorans DSM 12444]SCY92796.1 3-ketosteroid 9alpha-monooxygenase subunit A [Novosphingobium aromaticivorans]